MVRLWNWVKTWTVKSQKGQKPGEFGETKALKLGQFLGGTIVRLIKLQLLSVLVKNLIPGIECD